jgi:hypothetical protein
VGACLCAPCLRASSLPLGVRGVVVVVGSLLGLPSVVCAVRLRRLRRFCRALGAVFARVARGFGLRPAGSVGARPRAALVPLAPGRAGRCCGGGAPLAGGGGSARSPAGLLACFLVWRVRRPAGGGGGSIDGIGSLKMCVVIVFAPPLPLPSGVGAGQAGWAGGRREQVERKRPPW